MTIRKEDRDGESHWVTDIPYKTASGKRQRYRRDAQVQSKNGAEAEHRRLIAELAQRGTLAREPPSVAADAPPAYTFDDAVKHFRATHMRNGIKPSTRAGYANRIDILLMPRFGGMPLDEVDGAALTKLDVKLVDELASSTRGKIQTVLRSVLRCAVRAGMLKAMPALPPLPKVGRKVPRPMRRDDLEAILRVANAESRLAFELAAFTGLRAQRPASDPVALERRRGSRRSPRRARCVRRRRHHLARRRPDLQERRTPRVLPQAGRHRVRGEVDHGPWRRFFPPFLGGTAAKSRAEAMLAWMKIYTRTGDAGETGLFGGARVGKDDPRVEAYGTVDELNSCLGVARALGPSAQTDAALQQIQSDLFTLGAELACVPGKEDKLSMVPIGEADIARLEGWIDRSEEPLEPLKNFVLPGGCGAAAELHRARTVCRRAERRTLTAGKSSAVRPGLVIYLNRLSDLLFVFARYENHVAAIADVPWHAR